MALPSDVSFSPGLTAIALQYTNKELIADKVLPITQHSGKTGRYKVHNTFDQFDIEGGSIGPVSAADEVSLNVTESSFSMEDFGYVGWVSQQEINNAEAPIQPLSAITKQTTRKVLRRRERRVAQAVLNTSNYAAGNQVDIAGAWATASNATTWSDILTGLDACAATPNVMVLDVATFRALQKSEKVLAAIKGTLQPQYLEQTVGPAKTGSPVLSESVMCPALAGALGLDGVYVGSAWYASSKKGQTVTKARIWDLPNATKGGAAFLRVKTDQVEDVVWGMQMMWQQPLRVLTWFDPNRGADGSTAVKVVETTKVVTMANDAGYLFVDTLVT